MKLTLEEALKMARRARGGRTLPRSGGGVHKDTRRKLREKAAATEAKKAIEDAR
jgi:hypothetical protein